MCSSDLPKNKWELSDMMKYAVEFGGPIAVRYPRGEAYDGLKEYRAPIELGKSELLREGKGVALMALGSMVPCAMEAAEILKGKGIDATVVNARFAMHFWLLWRRTCPPADSVSMWHPI